VVVVVVVMMVVDEVLVSRGLLVLLNRYLKNNGLSGVRKGNKHITPYYYHYYYYYYYYYYIIIIIIIIRDSFRFKR